MCATSAEPLHILARALLQALKPARLTQGALCVHVWVVLKSPVVHSPTVSQTPSPPVYLGFLPSVPLMLLRSEEPKGTFKT